MLKSVFKALLASKLELRLVLWDYVLFLSCGCPHVGMCWDSIVLRVIYCDLPQGSRQHLKIHLLVWGQNQSAVQKVVRGSLFGRMTGMAVGKVPTVKRRLLSPPSSALCPLVNMFLISVDSQLCLELVRQITCLLVSVCLINCSLCYVVLTRQTFVMYIFLAWVGNSG